MIEYIKGELTDLTPAVAVVEAAGIGYALNISLTTYTAIQGKKQVKLFVHESLVTGGRDDSFTLFGFQSKQERALYRLLITVSGVGANTARMMLSSMTPAELCNAIATGDERMIKSVKGIGLKTAQRVIVDLKDKPMNSTSVHRAEARHWLTRLSRTRPWVRSQCLVSHRHRRPKWLRASYKKHPICP